MMQEQSLIDALPASAFEFDKAALESPPNCFVFGLYTLATLQQPIPPVASLFAEHSFSYWDDHHQHQTLIDPVTGFAKFAFFKHHVDPYLVVKTTGVHGVMADMLAERCGISIDVVPFTRFEAFLGYLTGQLGQHQPTLVDFDMGYIPSRPGYRIVRGYEHTVLLSQFDRQMNSFMVNDQDYLNDPVPVQDFRECFESMIRFKGSFNCYQVRVDSKQAMPLNFSQIKADAGKNARNLTTAEPGTGVQAVHAYIRSMEQLKRLNEPFSVFGNWIFVNQRTLQVQWCDIAEKALNCPGQISALHALREHLHRVLSKWNEYAMLGKMAERTRRVSPAQVAQKGIDAAKLELLSPQYWVDFNNTLAG